VSKKRDIDVIGSAPPFTDITLFDHDRNVGTARTDGSGDFFVRLSDLTEGNHEFKITATISGRQSVSNSVKLFVDASAPFIVDIQFIPSQAILGQDVIVILSTNETAEIANLITPDGIKALEGTDRDNTYTAIFNASQEGLMTISVELGDELGNIRTHKQAGTLDVTSSDLPTIDSSLKSAAIGAPTLDLAQFEGQFALDGKLAISGLILLWETQGVPTYDVYQALEGEEFKKINSTPLRDTVYIYTGSMFIGKNIFRVLASGDQTTISEPLAANVDENGTIIIAEGYTPLRIGAVGFKVEGGGLATQRLIPTIPFLDLFIPKKSNQPLSSSPAPRKK